MNFLYKLKLKLWHSNYYNKDNSVKQCIYCENDKFKHSNIDIIAGVISEYDIHCENCNKHVDYFSYGYYEPVKLKWKDLFR